MPQHRVIKRYYLIIERVQSNTYPSFDEILAYLQAQDHDIRHRTLQRDIRAIRNDFDLEIAYDYGRNGYYLDRENSLNVEKFLQFLDMANTSQMLVESLKDGKGILQFLEFEKEGMLEGTHYLKPLMQAILKNQKIRIEYEKFTAEEENTYVVAPHMLKEYQNRWYLIGMVDEKADYRIFGIDRIKSLAFPDQFFDGADKEATSALFQNIVGLNYENQSIEEIRLSLTPLQGKYVKTLPLHASQVVLIDNETECTVKLELIPNFEFKQKLLMMGEQVKVLEPQWLAENIKKEYEKALELYGG